MMLDIPEKFIEKDLESIESKLFKYQKEDVDRLFELKKGINGNPMGLGKTVEALALAKKAECEHTLIICTCTLIREWQCEIKKWLGSECTIPYETGDKLYGLDFSVNPFTCINYNLLTNPDYFEDLWGFPWDLIIFDEAHKLRNRDNKTTKSSYLLSWSCPRVVLMTGTPLQNASEDLYPLMHICNPTVFNSYKNWIDIFCDIRSMKTRSGRTYNKIVGNKHSDELKSLLSKYMVRHEKKEVLKDLPPKIHRTIPVGLGESKDLYDKLETEFITFLSSGEEVSVPAVLARLIRLRQICLDPNLISSEEVKTSSFSPKTQAIIELIESTDEKVVIFSTFAQYINMLEQELKKRKIKFVTVTGKTSGTERHNNIEEFQTGSTNIILGTMGALGEGVTLTASNICVLMDKHWNPAVNIQAEDRLHRIGQKNTVFVIDLYCEGTIEDHVRDVIRYKEDLFKNIVVADLEDEGLDKDMDTKVSSIIKALGGDTDKKGHEGLNLSLNDKVLLILEALGGAIDLNELEGSDE